MKLELKHVAPYLAYGVKIKSGNFTIRELCMEVDNYSFSDENISIKSAVTGLGHKLILRPLSDLRKDEYFDLYMDFIEEMESVNLEYLIKALEEKSSYSLNIQKLEILEDFMNKNHFDWKYNLIENGLAIDINTLK